MSPHPDDHYRQWPKPLDRREEEYFGYLRSLTPREELAAFLESRSAVWENAGNHIEAIDTLYAAIEIDVDVHPHRRYAARLGWVVRRWVRRLKEQGRIGHGFWCPKEPDRPRRWPRCRGRGRRRSWRWRRPSGATRGRTGGGRGGTTRDRGGRCEAESADAEARRQEDSVYDPSTRAVPDPGPDRVRGRQPEPVPVLAPMTPSTKSTRAG